ncbi:hypothetical protein R1sor_019271 [Riccia sorocarpa]|uniref:RRM domain-containing protein n=1 Tax=Riccia sorocarpa TaxID=122646 RepID=A0ABD3IFD2_9MARC
MISAEVQEEAGFSPRSKIKNRQWTSLSRLQVQVSFPGAKFAAISGRRRGLGSEAKSTRISGDFAGLSSLKEQLMSQSQPNPASGSSGRSSAVKESMLSQKRDSLAPAVEDTKKGDSASKNVERGGGGGGGSPICLMVSNLPKPLTREEFESFMEQIPEISGCRYLSHQRGICRGYGFCDLRPGADVEAVMEFLSKQTLGGNVLQVAVATGEKQPDKDSQREHAKPISVSEELAMGTTSSASNSSRRKQSGKDFKATLKLKNETRPEPLVQQAQEQGRDFSISSVNGDGSEKENDSSSKRLTESKSLELQQVEESGEVTTASSDKERRLSGESVLAAFERFASAGRGRQRRLRGTSGRSTQSDSEDDEESSSEPQLVEFKPEWAERIQSLEASLEQLKHL